ncbi:MAG TPA: YicC/YloC family endoribonuclease [Stellaceae bacterium]|nr:YicC/YloC family endoribonuclease [Stellaceae bacterium]
MTGFARAEGEADGVGWVWELRSVNGRALEVRLRLPPGCEALEAPARAALAGSCRRGNISATLTLSRVAPPAIRINRAMLAQIVGLLGDLSGELAGRIETAPPRLDGLVGLRGIIETVEDEPDAVVLRRHAALLDGWSIALDRLVAARREEGARLHALLAAQRAELAALVRAAAGSAAAQPAALRARLQAQLAELADLAPGMQEDRVAQELALLVTRADVREELDRLGAHIAQAGEILERDDAIGRQLDFLCQELNREANTLCSKSADIELTRIGLALKAAIEQFREQVQNLE